jgi:hypothetical protein
MNVDSPSNADSPKRADDPIDADTPSSTTGPTDADGSGLPEREPSAMEWVPREANGRQTWTVVSSVMAWLKESVGTAAGDSSI